MRILSFILFALVLSSCSQTKMLQKSLQNYRAPMGYLYDSKIIEGPKNDSLIIWVNNKSLDSLTSVTKLKGTVLPFIVFTYVESNMGVKLGQSSMEQTYDDFFATSLADESERSGSFIISNTSSSDSLYTLDIEIDTCITHSKYQQSTTVLFLFFAYSYSFEERGFPSQTNLKVTTKLRKGNTVVAERSYAVERTQPFLNPQTVSVDKLRADFTANMVESLSLSTKQCIEEIIRDVNRDLMNQNQLSVQKP